MTLLHENCDGWGGLGPKQTLELLQAVGSPAVKLVLAASSALACSYSAASRATSSAAVGICFTAPIPWPQPQMSRQALASWLPPELKFIFDGSAVGRLSGSRPARSMEGLR